ncbi:MAG: hypothetical protein JXD19_07145 [Deltaproteobacteria bacterium]|nr:hypothetical protein [Deltaproteobacteria bacterium]
MDRKLKERDIIKVKENVAPLNMAAGDHYRIEYFKTVHYEERCLLSRCTANGTIQDGDLLEIAARELDIWTEDGAIEISPAR